MAGNMKELAEVMAELTCELASACSKKENYFAAQFNLTPAEFKLLRLFKNTNSLSIKMIAALMELTPGRITHILTSLETKKFIKRRVDSDDKRNVIVTLTDTCAPFIKNLNKNHIQLHEELLSKIEEDKREFVLDAMKDVINAVKDWSQHQD